MEMEMEMEMEQLLERRQGRDNQGSRSHRQYHSYQGRMMMVGKQQQHQLR
jgi:hypothetical protein